jgi:hypothetical protein
MDVLRHALQVSALAILLVGPAFVLAFWWLRAPRIPTVAKYTATSVMGCTALFWMLFLLADYILELQFHDIVPDGSWTEADENAWTPSQRRIVEAHFGDGGRNIFALFAPILFLLYSVGLWAVARILCVAVRRRSV